MGPNATEVYRHTSRINAVKYQAVSGLLYCGTDDGKILALDTADDFRLVLNLDTGLSSVAGLDVHAADPIVAVSGQGTHQVWDCQRQARLFQEIVTPDDQNTAGDGFCLKFHVPPPGAPPSDWVIFGSFGDFAGWNVRTGERWPLFVGSDYNVCIAFHPAGDFGAVSCLEPQDSTFIGFFDFSPGSHSAVPYSSPLIRFEPEEGAAPDMTTDVPAFCVFNPSGNYIIASWANMNLMQTEEEIAELSALVGVVSIYRFPDTALVCEVPILGRREEMLKYEGYSQQTGHAEPVYGTPGFLSNIVLLGDNGSVAACGTPTGCVALVDWEKGKVLDQLQVHEGETTSVDVIGKTQLVSAGRDGRIVLFNAESAVQAAGRINRAQDVSSEAVLHKQEFIRNAVASDDSFYSI